MASFSEWRAPSSCFLTHTKEDPRVNPVVRHTDLKEGNAKALKALSSKLTLPETLPSDSFDRQISSLTQFRLNHKTINF